MNKANQKIIIFLLLTIITGGVIFRASSINSADLVMDEAKEFLIARGLDDYSLDNRPQPLQKTLELNKFSILQPPLMCSLLHYWSNFNSSIPWLRILPLIFSILVLFIMYYICRLIGFSVLWSLGATAFCSLSYTWFFMSLYLRSTYSFTIFSCALSILLVIRTMKKQLMRSRDCLILGLGISLACFSHYSFWFLLPFLILVILILIMHLPGPLRVKLRKALLFLVPLGATLNYIIFYQARYYHEFKELAARQVLGQPWFLKLEPWRLVNSLRLIVMSIFWQLTGVVESYHDLVFLNPFIYSVSLIFISGCICLLFLAVKQKNKQVAFIVAAFLWGAASISWMSFLKLANVEQLRYSVFFSPYLILSLFIGAHFLYRNYAGRFNKRIYRLAGIGLILVLGASNLYFSYRYRQMQYGFADIRGLLGQIEVDLTQDNSKCFLYVNQAARDVVRYHYLFTDSCLSKQLKAGNMLFQDYNAKDNLDPEFIQADLERLAQSSPDKVWVILGFLPYYSSMQNDSYRQINEIVHSLPALEVVQELKSNKALAVKLVRQKQ